MRPTNPTNLATSLPLTIVALVALVAVLCHSTPSVEGSPTQTAPIVVSPASVAAHSTLQQQQEPKGIFKRSFAGLGCLGVYDKAKFARLDRVCEECYTLYREPDIHSACR